MLRATIWLAVFAWAAAEVLKRAPSQRRSARVAWTAGAILLAVHTAIAFHHWHGWSHAAAYDATLRQSVALTGVAAGWGLYLNYAMVLVWLADAAWWWFSPRAYERRSRLLDNAIFVFFAFMILNGAVIFAHGPMRGAGVLALGVAVLARAKIL